MGVWYRRHGQCWRGSKTCRSLYLPRVVGWFDMESEEAKKSWPVIGQADVANLCREICESIVGLERAFEAGELSSRLTSGCFEQVLGPQLYETYGKLADVAPGPLHHLRVDAVAALL